MQECRPVEQQADRARLGARRGHCDEALTILGSRRTKALACPSGSSGRGDGEISPAAIAGLDSILFWSLGCQWLKRRDRPCCPSEPAIRHSVRFDIFRQGREMERRTLPVAQSRQKNKLTSDRPAKNSHHTDCRRLKERTEMVFCRPTGAESNASCAPH